MKIIIIGAGRIGTVMGYLLKENGFDIIGVKNKNLDSARRAVEVIGTGRAFTNEELKEKIKLADLIIVTTPDDTIAAIVNYLDHSILKKPVYIMHMSGLHPARILNKNNIERRYVFSLHPLQSVTNLKEGIELLPDSVFSLEGDKEGLEIGKMIANRLDLNYHLIKSENKSLYHAAAVIASNYFVTLVNSSFEVLKEAEIENQDIKKGILNLVTGTLSNLKKMDPDKALTGPVARGDVNTIKEHREQLKEMNINQLKLYDVLGDYTAQMVGKESLRTLFKS